MHFSGLLACTSGRWIRRCVTDSGMQQLLHARTYTRGTHDALALHVHNHELSTHPPGVGAAWGVLVVAGMHRNVVRTQSIPTWSELDDPKQPSCITKRVTAYTRARTPTTTTTD